MMHVLKQIRGVALTVLIGNLIIVGLIFAIHPEIPVLALGDGGCPDFPLTVSTENELNSAITCFNQETLPGIYTITLITDITLTTSTVQISNQTTNVSLVIDGAEHSVDGQGIAGVRPFHIAESTTVTMQAITVTGGSLSGADGIWGGGIYNLGALTLTDSVVQDNVAYFGGGIANEGTLMVTGSSVYSNTAGSRGGGIFACCDTESSMTINNSQIYSNTAQVDGGDGGGLWISICCGEIVGLSATIRNSQIYGNLATRDGGGIFIAGSTNLMVSGSTIFDNQASNSGGGMHKTGVGTVEMMNSTISGNSGAAGGGVAVVENGTLTLIHLTVNDNRATQTGGILLTDEATLNIKNSVVANSTGADCLASALATVINGGYNLIEDGSCMTGGIHFSGDPSLGVLANHGGNTKTHAPLSISPLVDRIPESVNECGLTFVNDQRGFPRPYDGNADNTTGCDIGAFEIAELEPSLYLPMVLKE